MPEPGEEGDDMKLKDQELMDPEKTPDTTAPDNNDPGHVFNRWRVIPYASALTTFDDNIFITAQNPQSDFYLTLEAGVAAGWGAVRRNLSDTGGYFRQADTPKVENDQTEEGNFAFANYSVSEEIFDRHTSQDAFNQDASLAGEWRFEKFLFGASIHYQSLTDIDIDVGGRVRRDVTTAGITTKYAISEKMDAEVDFSSTTSIYPTALNSTDNSIQTWLNYQVTGKINAGVGFKLGDLAVQESPSQIYETILLRGVYVATGKLSFSATVGAEARQLNGSDHFDPVFTLGVIYTPTDQTTFYVDGFRQTFSSAATAGEDIETTAISLRIRQRLFEKIYLTVGGGYQRGQYEEVIDTSLPNRADDSLDLRAAVSFDLTQWMTMEAAYEYRYNRSTEADRMFKQNLVTLELSVSY